MIKSGPLLDPETPQQCLRRSTANSRSNSKRIQSGASLDRRRRRTGKQHWMKGPGRRALGSWDAGENDENGGENPQLCGERKRFRNSQKILKYLEI